MANRDCLISPQVAIVLTDGLTNKGDLPKFRVSSTALKNIAHVIAVGVAGNGYTAELKRQQRVELYKIATSPQDLFYEASFAQLKDHVDPIARRACPV